MKINSAGGANRILYGEGASADTLELGYIYVDQLTGNIYGYSPTGNVLIGGPDFHIQDTDQLLDEGGANEVAVADIKSAVDASHTRNGDTKLAEGTGDEVTATELRARLDEALFSGSFDDLTDKPVTIPSPPTPLKLRTYNGVTFTRRGKDCMRAIYMSRSEFLKLSMEKKIPTGRRIIVTPDSPKDGN